MVCIVYIKVAENSFIFFESENSRIVILFHGEYVFAFNCLKILINNHNSDLKCFINILAFGFLLSMYTLVWPVEVCLLDACTR